jgi:hypothetical protein
MSSEPPTPRPDPGPDAGRGARPWLRPVALVVSCLVIGFVGGWVLRGDEGTVTVLAPSGQGPAADEGAGDGTAADPATTTAPSPTPPPARAEIALAVLNGTSEAGLAGRTAQQAESLGYEGVTAGNAPTRSGPSVVYFRSGQRPAARRVSRDLQISAVQAFPGGGALGDEVPADADVIVVLGPG